MFDEPAHIPPVSPPSPRGARAYDNAASPVSQNPGAQLSTCVATTPISYHMAPVWPHYNARLLFSRAEHGDKNHRTIQYRCARAVSRLSIKRMRIYNSTDSLP